MVKTYYYRDMATFRSRAPWSYPPSPWCAKCGLYTMHHSTPPGRCLDARTRGLPPHLWPTQKRMGYLPSNLGETSHG